jgi:hypothetical protein
MRRLTLGLWVMLAPILLNYGPLHIGAPSALIGGMVRLVSFFKGQNREHTGGGWSRVWTTPSPTTTLKAPEREWKKAG